MSQHTCFSIFRSPSSGPEAGWGCGNSSRLAAFSSVFSPYMETDSRRETLGGSHISLNVVIEACTPCFAS
jgi:hypothetical protein